MGTKRQSKAPKVLVAVGTDHHPFNRLTEWIDAWAAAHPDVDLLVQRGTSQPTAECPSVELLAHAELCELFATAAAVISHGGPSTVMDARMAGRVPIVVARDPDFDEHVDDHQLRFAEYLDTHDLAVVVGDEQSLHEVIDEALANPSHFTVPVEATTIRAVVEFGRMVDSLLQTDTPLLQPEGFEAPADIDPFEEEVVPVSDGLERNRA